MRSSAKALRQMARYIDRLADQGSADHTQLPVVTNRGIRYPVTALTLDIVGRKLYTRVCSYCKGTYQTKNPKVGRKGSYCGPRCKNAAHRKGL